MCVESLDTFERCGRRPPLAQHGISPTALLYRALIGILLFAPATAPALSTDTEQPVHISADSANLNERSGVMTYQGNVRITQGSMVIAAETVTTYAPGRQLERVVSEGRPATWQQTTDEGKEVRAEAGRIEYFATTRRLVLTGAARLWRDRDEFIGELIEYDLETETMDAASSNEGRVEVILRPRQEKE